MYTLKCWVLMIILLLFLTSEVWAKWQGRSLVLIWTWNMLNTSGCNLLTDFALEKRDSERLRESDKQRERDGEMERWRDGEMERWRDGEMERWRERERERVQSDGNILRRHTTDSKPSRPRWPSHCGQAHRPDWVQTVTQRKEPADSQSCHEQDSTNYEAMCKRVLGTAMPR